MYFLNFIEQKKFYLLHSNAKMIPVKHNVFREAYMGRKKAQIRIAHFLRCIPAPYVKINSKALHVAPAHNLLPVCGKQH